MLKRRGLLVCCLTAIGGACLLGGAPVGLAQGALIIDHNCTDLSQVPVSWIEQAKDMFFMSYGHTSHGSQIVTGMVTLNNTLGCSCGSCGDSGCLTCTHAFCDDYYFYKYGESYPQAPAGVLSFWDGEPEGASDLGNPNRTAWEAATRAMLEDEDYDNRNLVMWSWCGQVDGSEAEIQLYLDLMSGLESDYPDVTFVYMTGHLNGTGVEGNVNQRNEQIRAHCIAHNAVLFDFADIESYDPDGDYFLDLYADDACNYSGGNWAVEWCDEHAGSDLCATCSCAHSHSLNCNLKGRAFWWMMARLAGWPGPEPVTCMGDMDCGGGAPTFEDISYFVAALSGEANWTQYYQDHHGGTPPTCPWLLGDYGGVAGVEFTDIVPFANSIGQACQLYTP